MKNKHSVGEGDSKKPSISAFYENPDIAQRARIGIKYSMKEAKEDEDQEINDALMNFEDTEMKAAADHSPTANFLVRKLLYPVFKSSLYYCFDSIVLANLKFQVENNVCEVLAMSDEANEHPKTQDLNAQLMYLFGEPNAIPDVKRDGNHHELDIRPTIALATPRTRGRPKGRRNFVPTKYKCDDCDLCSKRVYFK
jgi:hypothetical protein